MIHHPSSHYQSNEATGITQTKQDASTPPAATRVIGERIAGAQVEAIAGAAHLVPMEAPQEVNRRLQTFFSEVERGEKPGLDPA